MTLNCLFSFPPDVNTIPHHLSETLFRHFEPHIALAVRNWPSETCFDLDLIPMEDRYAPSTFVGRFRDAILSLQRFKWETTMIDVPKLWELSSEKAFCVWWEAGTQRVWFKTRRRAGRPSHLVGEARDYLRDEEPSRRVVPWKDHTPDEIAAAVLLLTRKRIAPPVEVEGAVDASPFQDCDVAFTYDNRRNVTIIT